MKNRTINLSFPFFAFLLATTLLLTAGGSILFASGSGNQYLDNQRAVFKKLSGWDALVYREPKAIYDSLLKISYSSLSRRNKAYYGLIKCIVAERTGEKPENDSLISMSEKWFRQASDHLNLFRAMVYRGAINSGRLNKDSVSYVCLIEAENISEKYKIEDNYAKGTLFRHLGRINRHNNNYTAAEYYFKKGLDIAESNNDNYETYKLRIDLFRTYLIKKQYSEALECITGFADIDTLPPQTAYELYNELSYYHSSRGEFDLSISYLKNILRIQESIRFEPYELSSLYYRIAAYHNKYGNIDSSLYYSELAASFATDTMDTRRHFYFRNLAELYNIKGNDSAAMENYKIAYKSHLISNSEMMRNRLIDVEKKYEIELKEIQLQKARAEKKLYLFSTLLLLALVAFMIINARKKRAIDKEESLKTKEKLNTIESMLEKEWLGNRIKDVYSELMPKMLGDVARETERQRVTNPTFASELDDSLKEVREKTRNRLTEITSEESFNETYPFMRELPFLSGTEKIILVMLRQEYSTEEIAYLLCTSASSIRGAKGNIRKKILSAKDLPFDPSALFKFL